MAQQLHRASETPRERQSAQATSTESGRQGRLHTASMTPPLIAMRGIGQIYDMQMAATRLMLQAQASAASAFGWPDYSGLFQIADERARRVFSAGTEQLLHLAEQANETTSEVQRQVGRMLEFQAVSAAENWQRGLEEIGIQAEESLEELKELARQQTEEAMRMAESIGEEGRETIRQGGEQIRQTLRQGMEQGRELVAQQGEAPREQAERTGGAMRAAAEAAGGAEEASRAGQEPHPPSGPKRKAS